MALGDLTAKANANITVIVFMTTTAGKAVPSVGAAKSITNAGV